VSTHRSDVLVLGAGPAGLGAAYRLALAGRHVRVLERQSHVGGLAASFEVAGLRVDHGSHRLHTTTPAPIMATLTGLLGNDLQRRPRHGRIRMSGRFVGFPPRAVDLVRRLPTALSARLARDVLTAPLRPADDTTFASAITASLGPTMATQFYAPYVEKLFGVPAHDLAGELARRRVGARSAGGLVRRVVRPDAERAVFYYPRRGYGQISEALADAAADAGAQIMTDCGAAAIETGEHGARVTTGAGDTYEAAAVWSTLALPLVARLAGAPARVLAAAARLETRAMALVYLALPCTRWTPYDAHYFPELNVPMSRVSEPRNYRDSADDPRGVTVLCAEVPCNVGDEWWTLEPAEAGARVHDALERSSLPTPAPVHVEVRRVPSVYPIYRFGYEDSFVALDDWASQLPNFLHFGRQGLFAHDNTHHALAMAWAAADALDTDGRLDVNAWSRARAAFASHVVED
jgi:protoporphyrinogen oxidase